jgi:hypothetical protein
MMKNYLLIILTFLCSCKESKTIEAKNKTIDSLKSKLESCTAQAKIMADIFEKERIEQQNQKQNLK